MSPIPPPRAPRLERGVVIGLPQVSPINEARGAIASKVISILPPGDTFPGKRRPFVSLEETRRGGRARLRHPEDPWDDLK